eukprot:TRINITY_DN5017_c0_g1_i1.p1 TRINITY_DN5017_c0_g1~~TRINITY_DN5017_c0_g1_i1.p1  ORF type:complete len:259 (+),score=42.62 TRINITY_DN5017_c0_g1_i1:29-805(+)
MTGTSSPRGKTRSRFEKERIFPDLETDKSDRPDKRRSRFNDDNVNNRKRFREERVDRPPRDNSTRGEGEQRRFFREEPRRREFHEERPPKEDERENRDSQRDSQDDRDDRETNENREGRKQWSNNNNGNNNNKRPRYEKKRDTSYDYIIPRSNRYWEHDDRIDGGDRTRPRRAQNSQNGQNRGHASHNGHGGHGSHGSGGHGSHGTHGGHRSARKTENGESKWKHDRFVDSLTPPRKVTEDDEDIDVPVSTEDGLILL